ncbi:hypothetical protein [unidentified bacterial endosymbiont]|uniref:hypothetical protein n=1 Tax=unidentified bacterial endosymbiont TaxID=2355 RepID=UPI00209E2AAC|nr:hypothetical protein [unidentified bacterial endosymbiont]
METHYNQSLYPLSSALSNLAAGDSPFAVLLRALERVSFDRTAAALFGQLSQQFPQRKSSFDRMIAAHALALKVVLVTNHVADFERYSANALQIERLVNQWVNVKKSLIAPHNPITSLKRSSLDFFSSLTSARDKGSYNGQ